MTSNARCWTPRPAVLATATSLLTACATVGSDSRVVSACPPVVEYNRAFQARAADELTLLPERSAIVELMADYAVMRDQAQAIRRIGHDGNLPGFAELVTDRAPNM